MLGIQLKESYLYYYYQQQGTSDDVMVTKLD